MRCSLGVFQDFSNVTEVFHTGGVNSSGQSVRVFSVNMARSVFQEIKRLFFIFYFPILIFRTSLTQALSLGYKSPSAPRIFASLRETRSLFKNFRSNSPRRPIRHYRNCCATHLELCEPARAAVLYLVRTSACTCTQKQSCPRRHAPFTAGTRPFRLWEAKKIFLAENASSLLRFIEPRLCKVPHQGSILTHYECYSAGGF